MSRRTGSCVRLMAALIAVSGCVAGSCGAVRAQSGGFVGNAQLRPFVIGIIPVVGRDGAVGGVTVDAQGVVALAEPDQLGELRRARLQALAARQAAPLAGATLRKLSLRRLEAELAELRRRGEAPGATLQYLAGLQRVEYLFVDPHNQDLILAGPAEPFHVGEHGEVVGLHSGRPPVQLDDLLIALRTAETAASGENISCSIDPTEEGLARYARLIGQRRLPRTPATLARLEQALGPQQVTLTGVPDVSHFARVLLAADFHLKCIAMDLEAAPVEGLPSYLELMRSGTATPQSAAPRFWIAPNYTSLRRDDAGLAWQLSGPAMQVLTEEHHHALSGSANPAGDADSPAHKWAERATRHIDQLADRLPAFAQLRNCMDLAVVAAIITKHRLADRAACPLELLHDAKAVQVATLHVPRTLPSRAAAVAHRRSWIVGVSGGVDLYCWHLLDQIVVDPKLSGVRHTATTSASADRWWWD